MPEFQYWITPTAFFLLGSFVINVVLGLIVVRTMISKKWIVTLVAASFVITIVGWWMAARQEEQSARMSADIRKIAAAIQMSPDTSAQTLADEILRRLPSSEWHLTADEKEKLGEALDSVPVSDRFPIMIFALIGSTQSQMYKDDLAVAFDSHHWSISGGVDTGLRADLAGLFIGVSPEVKSAQELPPNAVKLGNILNQAGINFQIAPRQGLAKESFQLDVGARPTK